MNKPVNDKHVRVLKRLIPVHGLETLYALQGRDVPRWEDPDGAYSDASHVIAVKRNLKDLAKPNAPIVMRVRLNKSRVSGCIEDWFLITQDGVTKSYYYYTDWHKRKAETFWPKPDKYKYLREGERLWVVREEPMPRLRHKVIPIYEEFDNEE